MKHVSGTPRLMGVTGHGGEAYIRNAALRALQSDGKMLVYAVRCVDGLIKIGASIDVTERLLHIPHTDILALVPGSRERELDIHADLKAHRARGHEYYHPTPEVLAVVNTMRDAFNLPHIAA